MEGNARIWRLFQVLGSQIEYAGMDGAAARLDFTPFMLALVFGEGVRGPELEAELERLRTIEGELLQAARLRAKLERDRAKSKTSKGWGKAH